MARAFLLTLVTIPVCAAILAAIAAIGFDHLTSDDPVPDVLVGSLVFGALASVVIVIAGKNSRRAYRGDGGRGPWVWLAYAVPVLVLAGAGVGIAFMAGVIANWRESSQQMAQHACEAARAAEVPVTAECPAIATRCRRWLRDHPPAKPERGAVSHDPLLEKVRPGGLANVQCIGAGGPPR